MIPRQWAQRHGEGLRSALRCPIGPSRPTCLQCVPSRWAPAAAPACCSPTGPLSREESVESMTSCAPAALSASPARSVAGSMPGLPGVYHASVLNAAAFPRQHSAALRPQQAPALHRVVGPQADLQAWQAAPARPATYDAQPMAAPLPPAALQALPPQVRASFTHPLHAGPSACRALQSSRCRAVPCCQAPTADPSLST